MGVTWVKGVLGIKKKIIKGTKAIIAIKKENNTKKRTGQNAAPQPVCQPEEEKERRSRHKRKISTKKLHKTPRGEENIYICKIYIKRRVYGYILKGLYI